MREKLLATSLAFGLMSFGFGNISEASSMLAPTEISAQATNTVDFEQGSMTDEEYFYYVLNQFADVTVLEREETMRLGDLTRPGAKEIHDINQGAVQIEEITEVTGEEPFVYYLYDEGYMVTDEVDYLLGQTELYFADDAEMLAQVQRVAERVGDSYVATELPADFFANNIESSDSLLTSEDLPITTLYWEGESLIIEVDYQTLIELNPEMASDLGDFPEELGFILTMMVTPADESLTIEMAMSMPEDALADMILDSETEMTEDLIYMTDSGFIYTMRASDVIIPSFESLDTITEEEFSAIMVEEGLE